MPILVSPGWKLTSGGCVMVAKSPLSIGFVNLGLRSFAFVAVMILVSASVASAQGGVRPAPDFPEDPDVVSPPIVIAPLYACASSVTVAGFIPAATVKVYINGVEKARFVGTSPEGEPTPVPTLVAGDIVTATQDFGAITSASSVRVVVKNYLEDFPNGPPRPIIHAPLYECGISAGVNGLVTGSTLSVYSETQLSPGSFGPEVVVGRVANAGANQATWITPAFIRNARVTSDYEICSDVSPRSRPEFVQPEPATIPAATLDDVTVGQSVVVARNMLNGAVVKISSGTSVLGSTGGSSNGSSVRLSRPVAQGESLTITQEFCRGPGPPTTTVVSGCLGLQAPTIREPEVGDSSVQVLRSNPGARIMVYDRGGRQIGDGGGSRVQLVRRVTAIDEIWVVQAIGSCTSRTAYFVPVVCKSIDQVDAPRGNPAFGIGASDYSLAPEQINTRRVRMIGHVVFPTDGTKNQSIAQFGGPFPLVIILHGRSGVTRTPDKDTCTGPLEGPFVNEVQNHMGFTYWQDQLARMGIVSVSVSANDFSCQKMGDTNPFIDERAELIVRHLELWERLNDPNAPDPNFNGMFNGMLDLQRVSFAGHSRGGEAAVIAAGISKRTTSVLRSVVAIAPTDNNKQTLEGPSLLVILPAADGDVATNEGARIYDRAVGKNAGKWFKSQQYIYGANHNFFNREWRIDDGSGPDRIGRSDQEAMLSAWGSALEADTLVGEDWRAVLAGDEVIRGLAPTTVLASYQHELAKVVDNYQDGNGVRLNSLGLTVAAPGFTSFSEELLTGTVLTALTAWPHETTGLVAQWRTGSKAAFVSQLNATNAEPFEFLSFRASQTFANTPGRTFGDLLVGLNDSGGVRTEVALSGVAPIPFPYVNSTVKKAMLHTLRIPLKCFVPENGNLKLNALKEFVFSTGSSATGSIALDQLEFTR